MGKRRTIPAETKARVALAALRGERTINQIAADYQVHPTQVSQWKRQVESQVREVFRDRRASGGGGDGGPKTEQLYEKTGQLQFELDWLKKNSERTVAERRALIEPNHPRLSVRRQCELLGLSRGACYYRPALVSGEDLALMRLLDEEYTCHPFYGVRRMRWHLERQGWAVGYDRVRRLLRTMGLMALYPKPRLSAPEAGHTIYPYLLRNLAIEGPNHVWATDITYVPMARGFVYLTAVMDWFSRYVLAWRISLTLDAAFCLEALNQALVRATPRIFNSDQGSQFTSEAFTGRLRDAGIAISMDGRGRALDNVFIERLWRSVKYEEIYLKSYGSVWEAEAGIGAWFDFCSLRRPHLALAGRTPWEVYHGSAPLPSPQRGEAPASKTVAGEVEKPCERRSASSMCGCSGASQLPESRQ